MNWHCSRALVEEFSEASCLDTESSERLKSIRTAERSCFDAKKKATYLRSLSGMTYEPSTAQRGVDAWISSLRASRASRSVRRENGRERPTSATCGPKPSESLTMYDRSSRSWKTFQASLLADTLEPFSGILPKQGMMRSGVCWERTMLAPRTEGSGSGSWPTPTERDWKDGKYCPNVPVNSLLGRAVWATPNARDWKGAPDRACRERGGRRSSLPAEVDGSLNPTWVEWLMGWPSGWTDLEPLETDKFQRWLEQHGQF